MSKNQLTRGVRNILYLIAATYLESVRNIIQANKSTPQAAVISKLNPIIRGWCNYYSTVCSKNTFRNCKNIIWSQLRAWARYRTGNFRFKTLNKYWHYIEGRLTFSTKSGISLMVHSDTAIKPHVKVKKDKSYFDGDVLYWSTRKGAHPILPNRVALLLKKYKGRCSECGLMFVADDLIEVDHIIAQADCGKDKFDNLQPLHRHCHDVKTARDEENRKALEQKY